ncbi:hypothetical protein XccvBFoX7_gp44c [Xanthomonas phage FoX7]|uniref:Uncharacterized protein n=2 Tax=Carpasinavirus XcP1 TaxID=2182344 RepID=A0A858NQA0_9CAUD|nr:hypothetical protein XccvBFoX6_gp44c [Xanthomonas phage FoX6]QJB22201.1 hypothetical protein XccvBFoX7_gp44c [Xanthomonas phage FoX7]
MSDIDYFSDAPSEEEAPPATLERLTALAVEAKELEEDISQKLVALEELGSKLTKIKRDLIPSVMEELAMQSFILADGSKIEIKNVINASISEVNKAPAYNWLEENDFDGIIKTKVSAEFGRGEMVNAKAALAAMEAAGFGGSLDRSVHNATLKAFVKEQLEKGEVSIPLDLFGVFEFKEAKITLPKKPKKR